MGSGERRPDEAPERHIAHRVGEALQQVDDAEVHQLQRLGDVRHPEHERREGGDGRSREQKMYGRTCPSRVRVMSMSAPMIGSVTASTIFATVMMTVTTAMPALADARVLHQVHEDERGHRGEHQVLPNPAVTIASDWVRIGTSRSGAVVTSRLQQQVVLISNGVNASRAQVGETGGPLEQVDLVRDGVRDARGDGGGRVAAERLVQAHDRRRRPSRRASPSRR